MAEQRNNHEISLRINDRIINRWQRYTISADMLTPADSFELALAPARRDIWDLVPPDALVEVRIDDTPVVTGFIDERELSISKASPTITVTGRDKVGRMVDESSDLKAYGKMSLQALAEFVAAPTFSGVTLSNARNRDLVRGRRSGKAPAGSEPLFAKASEAPKKVEPGETRWDVLEQFLKPARLLAWSTADGKDLVVGLPNYKQGTQWRFFVPQEGSSRTTRGNVLEVSFAESVANRYSLITVVGSSRGDGATYGEQVTKHRHTTRQGPNADGTGSAFATRKQLIISDDEVKNGRDAKERAARELAFRDAEKQVVEITVKGHSMKLESGDVPAVFTFDTMAELEIEGIVAGRYLIVSVSYSVDRDEGEITRMKLVPEGTELVT
jgi:prophage tail gpP-like protein